MKNLWLLTLFASAMAIILGTWYIMQRKQSNKITSIELGEWTIIIPGITGDLAKRRLIPALYHLHDKGLKGTVIGTGRKEVAVDTILKDAKKFIDKIDEKRWAAFSKMIQYQKLDPAQAADFKKLADIVSADEKKQHIFGHPKVSHRLIFLSLPADVFCAVTKSFVESGIVKRGMPHYMLFEKPFGWNLESAQELNVCLDKLLDEKQVYRVDHYVAKGLTQSLPYLSGTNSLFSSQWNSKGIESVAVLFHETIDIEGRGAFYDRFGAIKDVIQNHVLQLLAFFALDINKANTVQDQAEQKAAFLNSLTIKNVGRGQYEGYLKEKEVKPDSKRETYAAIELASSDPRWKDTTFLIEAGKALPKKITELRVTFRSEEPFASNQLLVQFAPKEQLVLHLNGQDKPIALTAGDFGCTEAYETILQDLLTEKLRYSVSMREVEAQWRLTDKILAARSELSVYKKGSMPTN